ncbi:hypothetical protein Patl1_37664 [Pistacia atlantica]|nr:hypothetical protein Patl1_37664 [Pistacia atlantica]
MDLLFAYWLI